MSGRHPLWAPWRMAYVGERGPRECIFCEPSSPRTDRERLILHRAASCFVLLNRYPYSTGHLMVAPYRHVARLEDLSAKEQSDLMGRISDAVGTVQKVYDCDGLNIGANLGAVAGAGFAGHLHFHVVPRWEGDVNFMTVLAETRVIPEHLETVFDRLASEFVE